jgi:hypothetical protein
MKFISVSAICICVGTFLVHSGEQKSMTAKIITQTDTQKPAVETDWAIYMDEPEYHFDLAKDYLQKGDYSKASSELKIGNSFLTFQKDRLAAASKQIEDLSALVVAGKQKDVAKLDAVTAGDLNVVVNRYAVVPLEVDASTVFEDAYKYHVDKAKEELSKGNWSRSASEIRKAASFIRLREMGIVVTADMDSAGGAMKDLASRVESGVVKDGGELEKVFQKVMAVFPIKKERSSASPPDNGYIHVTR